MKHRSQVLRLLTKQIGNQAEVSDIEKTAVEVATKWVDPASGGKESTNGLIYGLVQSGKTGVLTVTGAIGADEGYRTIIILTSDNDPLYAQTFGRAREAFPGMDILGKHDFKDGKDFLSRIRRGTCVIVTTKNAKILSTLIDNFKVGNVKGLSCLIIDDEADQASLNTAAKKANGTRSKINELISEIRKFFDKSTYLQVTATPQALFLQTPKHDFRPQFTVLSHPGSDYVGGDDFFGERSTLVTHFNIQDIAALAVGAQPAPTLTIPQSLLRALDTFMVAATYKRKISVDQNCAFLCHVSTKTADHKYIVDLFRKYKADLADKLAASDASVIARLRGAYEDLAVTHNGIKQSSFDDLIKDIAFFAPGIAVKLVNGETDEDVAVQAPYNLFVGGNKLGRGVTIKNLLVSYYGRNPKQPQADTVLQHARMYGYRRQDMGLLRLFLPAELDVVFKAINKMENGLRDLISRHPDEAFRGVYVEGSLSPTRKNVLAPGAVGIYSGGGSYNPAQVLRDSSIATSTEKLDKIVAGIQDKTYQELPIKVIQDLIRLTHPDPKESERIWDAVAVAESVAQLAKHLKHDTGFVYVDRDRGLKEARRETRGILEGGESNRVPSTRVTLFLLRIKQQGTQHVAWWPQIRFPDGGYAFAFSV
ncbi:MAG: Z1 domain-containing protein [Gemmatimonadales bacterium]|nr:Z1 domain-containing protein [Gemmatimonadales bacterium]